MANQGNQGSGVGPAGREKAVFSDGFKEFARGLAKLSRRMQVVVKELEYGQGGAGTREYSASDFAKLSEQSISALCRAAKTIPKDMSDCLNGVELDEVGRDDALVALEIAERHIEAVAKQTDKLAEAEPPAALVPLKKAQLDLAVAFMHAMSAVFGQITGWLEYEGQYVDKEAAFSIMMNVDLQPHMDRVTEAASAAFRQLQPEAEPAKPAGCAFPLALATAVALIAT